MLKIPLLVSLGHHGGRRKVASSRPPFSTPLRSLGEPDPETPFLVPIEHAPPLFVRIREDKISLKISPAPLRRRQRARTLFCEGSIYIAIQEAGYIFLANIKRLDFRVKNVG